MSAGKPSVSARVSISWPPAPPIEDSSVLVLSSSPYRYTSPTALPFLLYLDLRLSLPLSPSSQITWGFAGIRHTLQVDPHPKFRWDHFIDSRKGREGRDTVDEGETIVLRDAITGENVEVEAGVGWNPDAGRVQRYEEVWSEQALVPGQFYIFLTIDEDPRKSDAFIAVAGPYALALSQTDGEPFQAVRMTRVSSSSPSSGHPEWEEIFSTSPSPSLCLNIRDALCSFLDLLNEKESRSTRTLWIRGDKVRLGRDNACTGKDWTVFDCGNLTGS